MRLALAALALAFAVITPACAADSNDDEETDSDSSEALSRGVDCTETTMTGYSAGKSMKLDVITIDGKRTTVTTGHAFLKLRAAAQKAGVSITIASGFRTQQEQVTLYGCYKSKKCNHGNLAAKPGYSNHQDGKALDLSTSSWLSKNARKYGFVATVKGEPWHYEYNGKDPGGVCSPGAPAPKKPVVVAKNDVPVPPPRPTDLDDSDADAGAAEDTDSDVQTADLCADGSDDCVVDS